MLVTLSGMEIDVRAVHPQKAEFSIFVTVFGIVTEMREMQSMKAYCPMRVTLSGMTSSVASSPLRYKSAENTGLASASSKLIAAHFPISVMYTASRETQSMKAQSLMLVTPFPMVTEVSEVQLQKA